MTETVFFRLLTQKDKAASLVGAVADLRAGRSSDQTIYRVPISGFRDIPSSPLAYWLSPSVRAKFNQLSLFDGNGRQVRVGLQTSDDFRFVRAWWEVAPSRLLDAAQGPSSDTRALQTWCTRRTFQGKRWVPFAKGGEFSPFYADLSMIVNWERDGEEIRQFDKAYVRNSDFYYLPGITWPLRGIHLSSQAVPAGCIFSIAGKMAFSSKEENPLSLLAIMNSRTFDYFVGTFAGKIGGVQYEVGLISHVPVPDNLEGHGLETHASSALVSKLSINQIDETSHAFVSPALLIGREISLDGMQKHWASFEAVAERDLLDALAAIDDLALDLYGIVCEDREAIVGWFAQASRQIPISQDQEEEDDSQSTESPLLSTIDPMQSVHDLVSYGLGCTFGRWDIRIGCDATIAPKPNGPFDPLPTYSPASLVSISGLPAISAGTVSGTRLPTLADRFTLPVVDSVFPIPEPTDVYQLPISWDGIVVDDPGHSKDIVGAIRDGLQVLLGESTENFERAMCESLGVKSLHEYLRNPRGFFDRHIRRYSKSKRKAPIYWLLQSNKRSYGPWLYYQRLDEDLLFKAVTGYVDPKIQLEEGHLRDLQSRKAQIGTTGGSARQIDRDIERLMLLLSELNDFRDKLHRAASLGLKPDLDDGVVLNAAPLWELMPWKEPKAYWEDLRKGKYEWSSIGKQMRARGLVH